MKRILCVWFPDWPIQHLLRHRPELGESWILFTENLRGRDLVRFGCGKSNKAGVRRGMPLSEALSYFPPRRKAHVQPLESQSHEKGLKELAVWCERYSPIVSLEEAEPAQALLMDVTGLGPLFSGEKALAEEILRDMTDQGYTARIGVGETVGMAWAAARFLTDADHPAILPAGEIAPLLPLPVQALRLETAHLEKLHKLGVKTIQQVLRLDPAALKARFGKDLLVRLEQFTGERRETITPYRPPPVFLAKRILELGTTHYPDVEELARRLLRQVVESLKDRHLGTTRLCCRLITEDRNIHDVSIRLRDASGEFSHLEELLRLHLERVRLGSPLIGMELEAENAAPLKWTDLKLFDEESRREARLLTTLLDRLANRLGEERVVYAIPGDDPVPERAVDYQPVTKVGWAPPKKDVGWAPPTKQSDGGQCPPYANHLLPLDRPPCLLLEAKPVDVIAVVPAGPPSAVFLDGKRETITKCWGPERIETAWWRGSLIRRDYYRVEIAMGERLWLYRSLADQRWFCHGALF